MILCISPNTNIERTWTVPGLKLGGAFRATAEVSLASGKGINVARAVQELGGEPLGMGFVAGLGGQQFAALAQAEGMRGLWTQVAGEERLALAMYDPQHAGDATLVSGPGPQVDEADWLRLEADVLSQAAAARLACFSGSLPPGSPPAAFARLVGRLGDAGVAVWLDVRGAPLHAALQARPAGVKINVLEAEEATGLVVDSPAAALQAARRLCEMGAGRALITLGRGGAVLASPGSAWRAHPLEQPGFLSSVGSGDAFMAGWLVGLERGLSEAEALRQAAAAGAANTLSLGGGLFSPAEYQAALERAVVAPL